MLLMLKDRITRLLHLIDNDSLLATTVRLPSNNALLSINNNALPGSHVPLLGPGMLVAVRPPLGILATGFRTSWFVLFG